MNQKQLFTEFCECFPILSKGKDESDKNFIGFSDLRKMGYSKKEAKEEMRRYFRQPKILCDK